MSKRQRDRHKEIREFRRWEKKVFAPRERFVFKPVTLDVSEKGLLLRRERERMAVLEFFGIDPELLH